jgi:hypothetical protein
MNLPFDLHQYFCFTRRSTDWIIVNFFGSFGTVFTFALFSLLITFSLFSLFSFSLFFTFFQRFGHRVGRQLHVQRGAENFASGGARLARQAHARGDECLCGVVW